MRIKSWITLGVTLVVLVFLYFLTQMRQSRHTITTAALFDADPLQVARFEVLKGEESVELSRRDTMWIVTGYDTSKVKQWRIDNFVEKVLTVQRESLISEKEGKWATYGVDDSTAKQLLVYDYNDHLLGHYYIGRSTSNWQSSYIRDAGSSAVYMTKSSIFHFIDATPDFWLEPKAAKPNEETSGIEKGT